MQELYFKMINGKSFLLKNLSPETTILDLKERIQKEQDIEINSQKLIFGGKVYGDNANLREINFSEATVNLVVIENPKKADKKPEEIVNPQLKQVKNPIFYLFDRDDTLVDNSKNEELINSDFLLEFFTYLKKGKIPWAFVSAGGNNPGL